MNEPVDEIEEEEEEEEGKGRKENDTSDEMKVSFALGVEIK